MSASKSEYGICRLDLEAQGTFGWQVRLQRNGVRFARFFADVSWGGRLGALAKARQYRDRLLNRLDRSDAGRVRRHAIPAARNQSGVVGVARVVSIGANGDRYAFWQASWSPSPKLAGECDFPCCATAMKKLFDWLATRAKRESVIE